jgi:hypothetical protein
LISERGVKTGGIGEEESRMKSCNSGRLSRAIGCHYFENGCGNGTGTSGVIHEVLSLFMSMKNWR